MPQHARDIDPPSSSQTAISQRVPITPRPTQRLKQEHPDAQPPRQRDNTEVNAKSPTAERDSKPPPAKRSRKAINCEPCRSSKLKCDRSVLASLSQSLVLTHTKTRGRPCSSCVLRGKFRFAYIKSLRYNFEQGQHCYATRERPTIRRMISGELHSSSNPPHFSRLLTDKSSGNRIDPHHEIARIRHSLATLEAYVIRGGGHAPPQPQPAPAHRSESVTAPPIPSLPDHQGPSTTSEPELDDMPDKSVPGMLAQKTKGGLYAGPTSMVTHLLSFKSENSREGEDMDQRLDDSRENDDSTSRPSTYDDDLLAMLPPLHIIDGLVDYYFEYCNWVYRHVHPLSFQEAWGKFKSGQSGDRLVLATLVSPYYSLLHFSPIRSATLLHTKFVAESSDMLTHRAVCLVCYYGPCDQIPARTACIAGVPSAHPRRARWPILRHCTRRP